MSAAFEEPTAPPPPYELHGIPQHTNTTPLGYPATPSGYVEPPADPPPPYSKHPNHPPQQGYPQHLGHPPQHPDHPQQHPGYPQQQGHPQQQWYPPHPGHNFAPPVDYLPTLSREQVEQYADDVPLERDHRPPSYWTMSIFVKWFCCLPLGIVAMHFSRESVRAADAGNYEEAMKHSQSAKKTNIIGIICGLSIMTGVTIFLIIFNTR